MRRLDAGLSRWLSSTTCRIRLSRVCRSCCFTSLLSMHWLEVMSKRIILNNMCHLFSARMAFQPDKPIKQVVIHIRCRYIKVHRPKFAEIFHACRTIALMHHLGCLKKPKKFTQVMHLNISHQLLTTYAIMYRWVLLPSMMWTQSCQRKISSDSSDA